MGSITLDVLATAAPVASNTVVPAVLVLLAVIGYLVLTWIVMGRRWGAAVRLERVMLQRLAGEQFHVILWCWVGYGQGPDCDSVSSTAARVRFEQARLVQEVL